MAAMIGGILLTAGPALAADGWVVRICRGATEAAAIRIEANEEGRIVELLTNWKSDVVTTDFPLPPKMAHAKQVHVVADSEPADGKVALCVLYAGKPAKAMNFTDLMEASVAQSDSDSSCACAK
jgi:hypothetical protein